MIHTFIKNQRRAISREFAMGRRNQTFTVINPLQGHADEPQQSNLAYDGKPSEQWILDEHKGNLKCRPYTSDATV